MTDKKMEGTLPLHTRCKLTSIARLHMYFVKNKVEVRTMSGLISSSGYLLEEILE